MRASTPTPTRGHHPRRRVSAYADRESITADLWVEHLGEQDAVHFRVVSQRTSFTRQVVEEPPKRSSLADGAERGSLPPPSRASGWRFP
jgi:hypothetical protein